MKDARDPHPRPGGGPRRRRALPRWTAVALGIGLGLASGLAYGMATTPQYSATAYVLVVPERSTDSQTALGFAQAYGRIATGSTVLAGAQSGAGTPAADLRGHVAAATSPDAPMISVTGTAADGGLAARIADAVARSLTATGNGTSAATGVRLLLFSPAVAPTSPTSPSVPLSAAVGASAGGLLGALALLVRRSPQDGWDAAYDGEAALDPRDDRGRAVPSPAQEQSRAAV
ncbi:lipopolysaccharide biosynthesis protein [Actinacidiphila acidipaludis]|uniref:Lipopolysaccharide biosynthesis protein n=1 Tax=Actinacidiphila acidipaludis TaxID=2873382 RepID=A0ABS7Q577_9ACTN|nr:lipopolysaccharide biosynthesis protein [Streptomyces acidipaludis]MBY8877575.1 lipopolysaccharide biosynthesis protein [Streptomyces acidipaludis]